MQAAPRQQQQQQVQQLPGHQLVVRAVLLAPVTSYEVPFSSVITR